MVTSFIFNIKTIYFPYINTISEVLKKIGDYVDAGEPISIVGNSGEHSTGPHLHFELWHNGYPIDPEKFINFQ